MKDSQNTSKTKKLLIYMTRLLGGVVAYLVLWLVGTIGAFIMLGLTLILTISMMTALTVGMLLLLLSTIPELIGEIASFPRQTLLKYYKKGSEEIQNYERFQKYRGELDLIFTSPPYFNREAYSEDSNQSYKKYGSSYEEWKEGFLRPTLETCVEFLKEDRYLLWNIADLKMDADTFLPLELDSREILEGLGMEYIMTFKMAQVGMPGSNRLREDGKPHVKNHCLIRDKYYKYEPVFVFKKVS